MSVVNIAPHEWSLLRESVAERIWRAWNTDRKAVNWPTDCVSPGEMRNTAEVALDAIFEQYDLVEKGSQA